MSLSEFNEAELILPQKIHQCLYTYSDGTVSIHFETNPSILIKVDKPSFLRNSQLWHLQYIESSKKRVGLGTKALTQFVEEIIGLGITNDRSLFLFLEPEYGSNPFYRKVGDLLREQYSNFSYQSGWKSPFNYGSKGIYWKIEQRNQQIVQEGEE